MYLYRVNLYILCRVLTLSFFFFFNDTATTEIYTLYLHDALPISFLIAARVPLSRSANTNGVNVSSSGSGPIRLVEAPQPFSSSSHTGPRRRTSRYTSCRPSSMGQGSTAYFASSRARGRADTTRHPG